jgi:hypothetical protein
MVLSFSFQNRNADYKTLFNKYNKDEKHQSQRGEKKKNRSLEKRRSEDMSAHKHKHTKTE